MQARALSGPKLSMRSHLAQTKLQAVKSTKAPDMTKARVVEIQAASDTYVVHKYVPVLLQNEA